MSHPQASTLKQTFDRDGVVIIRNFVPLDQVNEICQRAEQATKDITRTGIFSNVTKGLERLDDYFAKVLNNGPHVPILETLLGKKPEATTASFFTKIENDQEVHPHSDAMKGGAIWIALDESTKENGCLQFLKGSHLREEEFAHLKAHEPTDLSNHPDLFAAEMSPGDILFFNPMTIHWSGPNHAGTTRRGFNCFYTGTYWKHKGSKEEWKAAHSKKLKLTDTVS